MCLDRRLHKGGSAINEFTHSNLHFPVIAKALKPRSGSMTTALTALHNAMSTMPKETSIIPPSEMMVIKASFDSSSKLSARVAKSTQVHFSAFYYRSPCLYNTEFCKTVDRSKITSHPSLTFLLPIFRGEKKLLCLLIDLSEVEKERCRMGVKILNTPKKGWILPVHLMCSGAEAAGV